VHASHHHTDKLNLQVGMGNQKHTSHLVHADERDQTTWDLKCAFAVPVPIKNRIVKLELHSTSSKSKAGKVIAHAHVPLFNLMGFHTGVRQMLLWVDV